jgi:hypothetical protein
MHFLLEMPRFYWGKIYAFPFGNAEISLSGSALLFKISTAEFRRILPLESEGEGGCLKTRFLRGKKFSRGENYVGPSLKLTVCWNILRAPSTLRDGPFKGPRWDPPSPHFHLIRQRRLV